MTDCNTIKNPDNNTDRKLLINKGFKLSRNGLIVPDKYTCKYTLEITPNGGLMGTSSSKETWTVYQKKQNKPVVSIIKCRDGDYPPPDQITWF